MYDPRRARDQGGVPVRGELLGDWPSLGAYEVAALKAVLAAPDPPGVRRSRGVLSVYIYLHFTHATNPNDARWLAYPP